VLVTGFPADLTDTNCYVVAPGPGEQCVVIDPGINVVERLDDLLAEHRLHPVAVLLTHGHLDHTYSVLPVCDARDVPAYIHPADRAQLADPWSGIGLPRGAPIFGVGGLTFAEPADVRELADGEPLPLAGLELTVRHAPGHTPGSVAFSLAGADAPLFFSGDLLFAGSIGRVDLPGGSEQQMMDSLARVVLPLPDPTQVLAGHGPTTTIGQERASNPYLRLAAASAAG
jgi:glyoxylase-like metal-dependent hydrolase (beta-lactamase superfamily II)